jgi:ABC-2 type transport system ATP-binding protein
LNQIPTAEKCLTLSESPIALRVYQKKNGASGQLANAIAEVAAEQHWKIEELHTEEGRLDDVFRSITLSDTKGQEAK